VTAIDIHFYVWQHRTVLTIFLLILQTVIIAQTLCNGGEGAFHNGDTVYHVVLPLKANHAARPSTVVFATVWWAFCACIMSLGLTKFPGQRRARASASGAVACRRGWIICARVRCVMAGPWRLGGGVGTVRRGLDDHPDATVVCRCHTKCLPRRE